MTLPDRSLARFVMPDVPRRVTRRALPGRRRAFTSPNAETLSYTPRFVAYLSGEADTAHSSPRRPFPIPLALPPICHPVPIKAVKTSR